MLSWVAITMMGKTGKIRFLFKLSIRSSRAKDRRAFLLRIHSFKQLQHHRDT